MTVIITDDKLTENKKQECYKYAGMYKAINKISHIIEELEELDNFSMCQDFEYIKENSQKELNKVIADIEQDIRYAKRRAEQIKQYMDNK